MTSHTLVLLRHAKAETPGAGRSDAERQLAERGRVDAGAAGAWLVANALVPDLVMCSPARRTRQTWTLAEQAMLRDTPAGAGAAVGAAPVALVPDLYSAGVDAMLALITAIPEEIGTLVIVGHNPTISVASAMLDPDHGHGTGLRTASLAVHTLGALWAGCTRGSAPLVMTHTARGAWRG